jgi:hypothetical protein
MGFIRMEGVCGQVFVPEGSPEPKKHPCPDCFECQQCSDDRCRLCSDGDAGGGNRSNRFCGDYAARGKGPNRSGDCGLEKEKGVSAPRAGSKEGCP